MNFLVNGASVSTMTIETKDTLKMVKSKIGILSGCTFKRPTGAAITQAEEKLLTLADILVQG